MLLDFLPMLLAMIGSYVYYKIIFEGYAESFEGSYGFQLKKWPLRLMLGTFVIVFAIPYFIHAFDPLNLWDEDGRNGSNFSVIAKVILASIPAAGASFYMLQKHTHKTSPALIATGVTFLAAFAAMTYYVLKLLLTIVKWLIFIIFGFAMGDVISSSKKSMAVHRCSNCHSEVSAGASHCPGCGATLN